MTAPGSDWHLTISRSRTLGSPEPGAANWKRITGGPEHLLRWLEDQLAQRMVPVPRTARIADYARALEEAGGESYRGSSATDRWATAAELLERRDELSLAGWDGSDQDILPPLVRDLARVEESCTDGAGTADRLRAIRDALDRGQTLPPHRIELDDPADGWPLAWQPVLEHLHTAPAPPPAPAAPSDSGLGRLQHRLTDEEAGAAVRDPSLRWISVGSVHGAAQLLAAGVAASDDPPIRTVVYTSDPDHAAQIEEAFLRLGLPACGAIRSSGAHPVRQILPIVLELLWKPVDPAVLMDFFSLPVSPVPPPVARQLAAALARFPGIGSRSWDEARAELVDDHPDLLARADRWLSHERVDVGGPVPVDLVAERCAVLAEWARRYARALEGDGEVGGLAGALLGATFEASALAELVRDRGPEVSRPQLLRMLDDVRGGSAGVVPHPAEVGAPLVISTLADVPTWCERLVWLGTGMEERSPRRWTGSELRAIREADIDLDDGHRGLAQRREAERRGLLRVSHSLLVFTLPADEERRPHPLWSRVTAALPAENGDPEPLSAERLPEGPDALGSWPLGRDTVALEPPQPVRPEWAVPGGLLSAPPTTSASEMQSRLACPLQWVLHRVARVRPAPSASLPNEFLLRGSFAHAVLEDVLGDRRGQLLEPDEVVRAVQERFDERLPLDAAPLAQPDRIATRRRFRRELSRATRVLAEALRAGGYVVEDMEAELDADLDGRLVRGRIDCLVRNDAGEAIVDFKYGGVKRYRELLEEGRATQLAVYAFARGARAGGSGRPLSSVAYLILNNARLYTPEGSPLDGTSPYDTVDEAPAIARVWEEFRSALDRAGGWLDDGERVPARPLQDPGEWPDGVDLVVETDDRKDRRDLRPCKYCDHQVLCGARVCS